MEASGRTPTPTPADGGELAVLALALLVGLTPLMGEAFGLTFAPLELGLGVVVSLLSGRELLTQALARLRAGR